MQKAICKNCGEEIGLWTDPWAGHPEWMHAPDDAPAAYMSCRCKCDACKPDTTLGIHDPCPPNCIDGEVAEPLPTVEELTANRADRESWANTTPQLGGFDE